MPSTSSPNTFENLVDLIYESAANPAVWENTLQQVAERVGSFGGLLFLLREARTRWVASPGAAELWEGFRAGGWLERNARATRLLGHDHAGWVHDLDLFTLEELDRELVYTEFFRKMGAGWGAGTAIDLPDGDSIFFTMERAYAKGPFPAREIAMLDSLRPHLARAAYLSMRLELTHAQATAAALSAVGTAAAVVRPSGRLLAANAELEALIPHIFQDRRDRLMLASKAADGLFAAALERLSLKQGLAEVASIPVKGAEGGARGHVVHLLPVRRSAHDIFVGGSCIVIATAVGVAAAPRATLLSVLFDLTPAEARVAGAIASMKTPEQIAREHGVSRETVRKQMKAIYDKTGMRSQSLLAQLIGGVGVVARL